MNMDQGETIENSIMIEKQVRTHFFSTILLRINKKIRKNMFFPRELSII